MVSGQVARFRPRGRSETGGGGACTSVRAPGRWTGRFGGLLDGDGTSVSALGRSRQRGRLVASVARESSASLELQRQEGRVSPVNASRLREAVTGATAAGEGNASKGVDAAGKAPMVLPHPLADRVGAMGFAEPGVSVQVVASAMAWVRADRVARRGEGAIPNPADAAPRDQSRRKAVKAGNAANPHVGCGMQQARGSRTGGNRQGGEKPRSRNVSDGWRRSAEGETRPRFFGSAGPLARSERSERSPGGGIGNPRRGTSAVVGVARGTVSEGEPRSRRQRRVNEPLEGPRSRRQSGRKIRRVPGRPTTGWFARRKVSVRRSNPIRTAHMPGRPGRPHERRDEAPKLRRKRPCCLIL